MLPRGKQHKTVGFYTKLVRNAVQSILVGGGSGTAGVAPDLGGDVGGYRDVGIHTSVTPLSTCWPLVEQVFRYMAEQVGLDHVVLQWDMRLNESLLLTDRLFTFTPE